MAKLTNHVQRTRLITPSTDKRYSDLTLKITSAQVVETSVTNNSSFQNYPHPDDHTIRTTLRPNIRPRVQHYYYFVHGSTCVSRFILCHLNLTFNIRFSMLFYLQFVFSNNKSNSPTIKHTELFTGLMCNFYLLHG